VGDADSLRYVLLFTTNRLYFLAPRLRAFFICTHQLCIASLLLLLSSCMGERVVMLYLNRALLATNAVITIVPKWISSIYIPE
jgi:hypothetical protein